MRAKKILVDYEKLRRELSAEAAKYRRFRPWAEDEDRIVRDFYQKIPVRLLAEKLGRSRWQLHHRAERLGVRRTRGASDVQGGS